MQGFGSSLDSLRAEHPELNTLDTSPCIFRKTKNYIDLVPEEFPDTDKNRRYLGFYLRYLQVAVGNLSG